MQERSQTPIVRPRRIDTPSLFHLLPALTVILFTRRRIGERFAVVALLLVMAGLLYLAAPLTARPADILALRLYALAIAVLALLHRLHLAWVGWRYGESAMWHSANRGQSWLTLLPAPLPDTFLHLVIEPALTGAIGWELYWHVSLWLGFLVVVGAIGVFATELYDYRQTAQQRADMRDALLDSRGQEDRARAWRRRRTPSSHPDSVARRPS